MRAIKVVSVGLIAAMVGMGVLGVSSAAAESTALCKEDVEVCPEGAIIEHIHGTTIGKAKLLTSILTIECDILSLGDVEGSALGSPLVFVGVNTYTNCSSGCTITHLTETGVIEVLKTGHETAQLTGESELEVNCSSIHCVYNGEGAEGTGRGPLLSPEANGDVTVVEREIHKVKGLFCPAVAKADFSSTALEPTYITN
jgi:hypothetical protein